MPKNVNRIFVSKLNYNNFALLYEAEVQQNKWFLEYNFDAIDIQTDQTLTVDDRLKMNSNFKTSPVESQEFLHKQLISYISDSYGNRLNIRKMTEYGPSELLQIKIILKTEEKIFEKLLSSFNNLYKHS